MKFNKVLNWLTHVFQNAAAIKPKPKPKDTRREGDHFYWYIKMFIHETIKGGIKHNHCIRLAKLTSHTIGVVQFKRLLRK